MRFYNFIIGDDMKGKSIIQLALSILIFVLFHLFYWKVFAWLGLHFSGMMYDIMNFIKYFLLSAIIFVIYSGSIRAGKSRYKKGMLNNIIYSVACFVFLIIVTIVLHDVLNFLSTSTGVKVGYHFTNYFQSKFTIGFALNLVVECIFIPFLLCVIFGVGFSSLFKGSGFASFMSGLTYGVIYALGLNTSFLNALINSLTPAVIVFLLTYLYRTNNNIWSVIITYAIYVLAGIFAINYIV